MANQTFEKSQEHEALSCSCCRNDRRLFLGEHSVVDTDTDSDESSCDHMSVPVHLGRFIGSEPCKMPIASQSSFRSLTTGSEENDHQLISGMMKSAAKRLQRECIDDEIIASIEESGTVGCLEHSQIELGKKLGDGSFSSVFEIKSLTRTNISIKNEEHSENPAPTMLVIKILKQKLVKRPSSLSMCAADLVKEGAILALLGRHQNVVSLVAWTPTGLGGFSDNSSGIRHDSFFLVLERLEKSLKERIEEWKRDKAIRKVDKEKEECFQERFQIMKDLANAVRHVHSKGIIHRDLKPNNIGFDAQGTLKLFDFDVSRVLPKLAKEQSLSLSKDSENATFRLTQHVGTQRYMSPECARGERYNAKSDVYAFGLVCHEILTLKFPYEDFRRSEDHFNSVCLAHLRPTLPRRWPRILRNFISNCWADSIPTRPTMEKAFKFLSQEAEIIATILERKSRSKTIKSAFGSFRGETPSTPTRKTSGIKSAFGSFQGKTPSTPTRTRSGKGFLRRAFSFADLPVADANEKRRIALENATSKEDSLTGSCFLRADP